jgi:hypothetical protein
MSIILNLYFRKCIITSMRILGMEAENTTRCCGIPFDPDCMFADNEITNWFIITQLTEPLEEICRLPESSQMFNSVTYSYCGFQA